MKTLQNSKLFVNRLRQRDSSKYLIAIEHSLQFSKKLKYSYINVNFQIATEGAITKKTLSIEKDIKHLWSKYDFKLFTAFVPLGK